MIYLVLKSNSKIDITNTDSDIIHKEIFNPCKYCYELNTIVVSVKNNSNTHETVFTKLEDVKCIEVLDKVLKFDNGFRVNTSEWINTRSDKLKKAFEIQRKYDLTHSKEGLIDETTQCEPDKIDEETETKQDDISSKDEGPSVDKEVKEDIEKDLDDDIVKVKFVNSSNDQEIFITKNTSIVELFEQLYENGVYKNLVKRDNLKFVSWINEETNKAVNTRSDEKIIKDLVFKAKWQPLNKKH